MTTPQEAIRQPSQTRRRTVIAILILLAVILASAPLWFRIFLYQPFSIPSNSMQPTLHFGDYVFAHKYTYGFSRFSFPYSQPAFSGRIFGATPERGDVIVFRSPKDTEVDYIKRVVGLPGDRIQMKQGQLFINGQGVSRERLEDTDLADACGLDPGTKVKRWRETLPGGASYDTLDCVDNGFYDNTNIYTVPPDHIFVLGDNRDNSVDSRLLANIGYVPLENVVGRVGVIFFSKHSERIGGAVH